MAAEILGAAGWDEEDRDEYYSRFILGRMVLCPIHLATPVFLLVFLNRCLTQLTKSRIDLH